MIRHAVLCLALVSATAGVRLAARADTPRIALKADKPRPEPPPDTSRKAAARASDGEPRTERFAVTLFNLHTREVLPVLDAVDARRLSRFLRCRATGLTTEVAAEPVEVALRMAERFESPRVEVVSGYRSDKLNESLRKKGHQVASRSRHVRGQALDFRIPEVGAEELARAVAEVHQGGIGTYRESGFVHVDVGPDRRWRGR